MESSQPTPDHPREPAPQRASRVPVMASAWAGTEETQRASETLCDRLLARFPHPIDAACVFYTPHHIEHAQAISRTLRERLRPTVLAGTSAVSIVGGGSEIERGAGISILAMHLPGISVSALDVDDLPGASSAEEAGEAWAPHLGAGPDLRCVLAFIDPFSVPLTHVLPGLNDAVARGVRSGVMTPPIIGGMASGAPKAGGNAIILDDRVLRSGGVAMSLRGSPDALHVDCVVSQGCKPIGPTFVVTKAKANLLFELSGRPVTGVIQEVIDSLSEEERSALRTGLFVGVVIDEYKPRFGRGDYLIRNLLGVDQDRGCVAVGELLRVGQTVRLHVRDAHTARQDLSLLLDAQKLYDQPIGSLLITCNSRGEQLFGTRDHDASAVIRAFQEARAGEHLASPGTYIDPAQAPPVPQAGFFAAGELGPVGGKSFVHAHTACVAIFRKGHG